MMAVLADCEEEEGEGERWRGEEKLSDGKNYCKINYFTDWYAFDEAVLRSAKPQNAEYNGDGSDLSAAKSLLL